MTEHRFLTGLQSGGDTILAAGPSPNGGVEMIVKKSDGAVVLLMKDVPQVRNTPKGPKMYTPQHPLELPLVRRNIPRKLIVEYCRATKQPPPPALLMFQSKFTTITRELQLP